MKSHQLNQEIKARLQELARETDEVKKSDFFKRHLEIMSLFWKYSYRNQLLINLRMPEATRVAGFKTWLSMGRNVKKGSESIKILAPFKKTVFDEQKQEKVEMTYFSPVNVFDVSQTEGDPLPDINIALEGDDQRKLMDQLLAFCTAKKIKVIFKGLGVNGLYGYSMGGTVAISKTDSINTQTNTLIHEIAHELLHQGEQRSLSKTEKEIQAEGVAHVVSKHFGLETKSFNYLALYDADYNKIMFHLHAIAEAAREVIEFISFSFLEKDLLVS